jgi:limonene-1,2-epoxide hydrolase
VTRAAHQLVETLLAARNVGSSEQVRALLAPDATHWDCLSGRVQGPEAVTEALVASRAGSARPSFVAERLAAAGGHAVVELRVCAGERSEAAGYPVTEVYELRGGLVAGCRAYLDPADVRRA